MLLHKPSAFMYVVATVGRIGAIHFNRTMTLDNLLKPFVFLILK